MLIRIHAGKTHLTLPLPNRLLLKTLISQIAVASLERQVQVKIPPDKIKELLRELRKCKKIHGQLPLVQVYSSEGKTVEIII